MVVREYMGENRSAYQAKIERSGNQLYISEGGRPIFAGSFHRYIEVSLPDGYANSLTVTTSDGDINFPAAGLELPYLRVDSTSGTITLPCAVADSVYLSSARGSMRIGCIAAAQIRLETTAGSAACDRLGGDMAYSTTSGDLEVRPAAGAGTYRANNSGTLDVVYYAVDGGLYLFNKNGDIALTLPEDLEFRFEAIMKNGYVSTSFQELLYIDKNTVSGTVGSGAAEEIRVETRNGDIEVRR